MSLATSTARRVKPRLRGVSHEITFYLGVAATAVFIATTRPGRPTLAALVYGATFLALFGISALYHRPMWTPERRALMRRLDHSAIFLLIAGTYTPIALMAVPPEAGDRLLVLVWVGAGLGVVQAVFWSYAPRFLRAGLYVLLGWAVVAEWSAVTHGLGAVGMTLMLTGGALYTLGALIYATRRPDPVPAVFGYHEVFHLLVIAAACCHAWMIVRIVQPG